MPERNLLWQRRMGGDSVELPTSITRLSNGDLLVASSTSSRAGYDIREAPLGGHSDSWLARVSAQGQLLWERRFGGSGLDTIWKMVELGPDRILLAGNSNSPADGKKQAPKIGRHDIYLLCIDGSGNVLWDRTYGGLESETNVRIIRRKEGGWLLAATSASGIGGTRTVPLKGERDVWVLALDELFNYEWDASFGGPGIDRLGWLDVDEEGNCYLGIGSNSVAGMDKAEDSRMGQRGRRVYNLWMVKIGPAQPLAYVDLRLELQNLEQSVILNWTRSEERSVRSYTVERSADLKRWRDVGRVDVGLPGMGGAGSHRYEDTRPLAEVSYYRLRIEETGGRQSYSEIREVRRPSGLGGVGVDLQLQPVPFGDRLRVVGRWEEPHRLRIRTLTGSSVQQLDLPAGEVDQQLDTSDWAAGVYLVEVWRGLRRVDVRRVLKL